METRRPFNGVEQEQLYTLFAMAQTMEDAIKGLDRRLSFVDRGSQKLKTASTYIMHICTSLIGQLSREQQRTFSANAKQKRMRIVTAGIKPGDGMCIVRNEDLRAICNAAWKEKCQMCSLRGQEAKQCSLKRAFDNTMMMETGTNKDCWHKPEGF